MYRVVRYSLKLSEAPRLLIAKSLSPLITCVIQIMKGTKASTKEERKKGRKEERKKGRKEEVVLEFIHVYLQDEP